MIHAIACIAVSVLAFAMAVSLAIEAGRTPEGEWEEYEAIKRMP